MKDTDRLATQLWIGLIAAVICASLAGLFFGRTSEPCESLQTGTVEGNRIFAIGCTDTRSFVREMVKVCAPARPQIGPTEIAAGEAGALAEVWCQDVLEK